MAIRTHTFPNGFRVVYQASTQPMPLSCIHVLCEVGSAYETPGIRGASHFVEHMCFKGTEKYLKARNLLVQYNKVGADLNGFTTHRYTGYTLTCTDTALASCTSVLAEMLLHANFPRKEFDKEQRVVVEENIRAENDPENVLYERLEGTYYKGSSYQYPVDALAYHPSDDYLKYDDMVEWHKWFYHPSNMLLSIVTNLGFATVLNLIRRTSFYTDQARGYERTLPKALLYPTLCLYPMRDKRTSDRVPIECVKKKGVMIDFLMIGFRTCAHGSLDKYGLMVLQGIMNGFSGRLFTLLRGDHGLTYTSRCSVQYHEHSGVFQFDLQVKPVHLIKTLQVVVDLIIDLKKRGVTQEEVALAKQKIQGGFLTSMQSISTFTSYNSVETLLSKGPIMPYQDLYDTYIKPITVSHVLSMIKTYLRSENMVMGLVYDHPIHESQIEKIVSEI
jgi:predicted Zn-dependent peptidase